MINKIYQKLKQSIFIGLALSLPLFITGCQQKLTGVLAPKGLITYEERKLLFDAVALMLIVVIPVIIMSFAFVFRYRETHKTSEYKPNWAHSVFLEAIWWGVPCVIIVILGIMTWKTTHQLDPYRKIDVPGKPMLIQGIALPWKWLFIYPEQNIATVNYLELPKDRQIEFWLTTDNTPMSSFFIPQLGSQIYNMAGMRTRLHLLANHTGVLQGLNTQYNGKGFSDMHFKVDVVEPAQMEKWIQHVKQSKTPLTLANYNKIRQPSEKAPIQYFSKVAPNLFNQVIQSYKASEHPKNIGQTNQQR
jgi:cytochrome o ubiquinol oxidase subunit II